MTALAQKFIGIPKIVEPRTGAEKQAMAEMKALRRGNRLGKGLSIRDLIEEGRRF